jgi:hypothetical protein
MRVILVAGEESGSRVRAMAHSCGETCMNGAPAVWVGFYVWATRPNFKKLEAWQEY